MNNQVEVKAESFGNYNHSGIVQVKHPVTGLLVSMAVVPQSSWGSKKLAAMRGKRKQLNKTLATSPKEQWSIDRRATLSERGYAKLVGFTLSHKYNKPATGQAQRV